MQIYANLCWLGRSGVSSTEFYGVENMDVDTKISFRSLQLFQKL